MAALFPYERIRIAGVLHILLGVMIISVGIVDRVELTGYLSNFPARYLLAIWMGSWIEITGIIALFISLRHHHLRKSEVIAYLIFSIVAIIFAVALLACYSVSVALIAHNEGSCTGLPSTECPKESPYGILVERECDLRVRLAVAEIFLSFLEILAIWWSVICFDRAFWKKTESPTEPTVEMEDHPPQRITSKVFINVKRTSGDRPISFIVEPSEAQNEQPDL